MIASRCNSKYVFSVSGSAIRWRLAIARARGRYALARRATRGKKNWSWFWRVCWFSVMVGLDRGGAEVEIWELCSALGCDVGWPRGPWTVEVLYVTSCV